jgi:hypothetical protein
MQTNSLFRSQILDAYCFELRGIYLVFTSISSIALLLSIVRIAFGHGFVRICQQPLQLLINNPLVRIDQWIARRMQSFLLRLFRTEASPNTFQH